MREMQTYMYMETYNNHHQFQRMQYHRPHLQTQQLQHPEVRCQPAAATRRAVHQAVAALWTTPAAAVAVSEAAPGMTVAAGAVSATAPGRSNQKNLQRQVQGEQRLQKEENEAQLRGDQETLRTTRWRVPRRDPPRDQEGDHSHVCCLHRTRRSTRHRVGHATVMDISTTQSARGIGP